MACAADLSAICRHCGICCDGTLYLAARLTEEEVAPMRKVGLTIVEDVEGVGFELPCPQLERATCSCSIYEARPRTCRRFQCALLERARIGAVPVPEALERVAKTKELIAVLQAKGMDMSAGADRGVGGSEEESIEILGPLSDLLERLATDFARGAELE